MSGINVNKLKGKIVERGMTVSDLAKALGVDSATLYRKLKNNGDTMFVTEANRIVDILGLSGEEAMQIFFSQFVA